MLARLVRVMHDYFGHKHLANVRFILAGVNPYFQKMADEDRGIERFFYRLHLLPLRESEAEEMIMEKFNQCIGETSTTYDMDIVESIIRLSGGHPHLLQLLGYHIVEHENRNPDDRLDKRDLDRAIRSICYEDRRDVYEITLMQLEEDSALEPFNRLLLAADKKVPTVIRRQDALNEVSSAMIKYFLDNNILFIESAGQYRLQDEFLRIRLIMDEMEEVDDRDVKAQQILEEEAYISDIEEYRDAYEGVQEDDEMDEGQR